MAFPQASHGRITEQANHVASTLGHLCWRYYTPGRGWMTKIVNVNDLDPQPSASSANKKAMSIAHGQNLWSEVRFTQLARMFAVDSVPVSWVLALKGT